MMEGWETTQWLDYVVRDETGKIVGIREDTPDFIKEQYQKEQDYIEECRRTGKKLIR